MQLVLLLSEYCDLNFQSFADEIVCRILLSTLFFYLKYRLRMAPLRVDLAASQASGAPSQPLRISQI